MLIIFVVRVFLLCKKDRVISSLVIHSYKVGLEYSGDPFEERFPRVQLKKEYYFEQN